MGGETKPACIHSKFFPGLQGPNSKMSSTLSKSTEIKVRVVLSGSPGIDCSGITLDEDLLIDLVKDKALKKQGVGLGMKLKAVNGIAVSCIAEYQQQLCEGVAEYEVTLAPLPTTIFMNDTPNMIKHKVHKYAFSGGQDTKQLHEAYGANLAIDVPFQYLRHLMVDDVRLQQICEDYKAGKLMTKEVKDICIDELVALVQGHQERLSRVTDDVVAHFMDPNRASLRF